jgi:hypothetical protein
MAYGDLVPLGFLLAALCDGEKADAVRQHLRARGREGVWAYHAGGLPTAIDTTLVAQSLDDPRTVQALQRFRVPDGGYVPQLWTESDEPGRMRLCDEVRHWCQPDFATTCMVVALRRGARCPIGGTWKWLTERFERRNGLFFANPFLTDWALSKAVADNLPATRPADELHRTTLADRLRTDVLAAQHADGSFGSYDLAFSTALAILALRNLGVRGRPILRAQLRLLDWVASDGRLPPATPFFSSLRIAAPVDGGLCPQHIAVDECPYALTFYRDDERLISTAVAALALSTPADDNGSAAEAFADVGIPHGRYGCREISDYIRAFALGHDG